MTMLYDRAQPEAGPSRPRHAPSRVPFSRLRVRQDQPGASTSLSAPLPSNTSAPAQSTPTDLFPVTSVLANVTSTYIAPTNTYASFNGSSSDLSSSTYVPASRASSSFSRPWQVSTRSTTSHAAEQTPYVAGVVMQMVLGGDNDDQAVYSVPMDFGHGVLGGSSRKRRPSANWNGGSAQTVNLQVDLGSSDMVRIPTNEG